MAPAANHGLIHSPHGVRVEKGFCNSIPLYGYTDSHVDDVTTNGFGIEDESMTLLNLKLQ